MTNGGVVGFGRQGKRFFNSMKEIAGINIIGICDINPKAFETTSGVAGIWEATYPKEVNYGETPPNFYTDWKEMLAKEPIDVLSVVTWTQDHAPVVIEAAKSGVKAILCEKPISNSLESAQQMIETCRKNNTLLGIYHTRRWWPEHQQIRKIIQQGTIGELRHLWFSCGGARLGDLAVHFIDWMRWITESEIDHIIGYTEDITDPNPRGPQFQDPPGRLYLFFKNGVDAIIHLGRNIALPPRYEIVGTKGRILIEEYMGEFDRWEIDVRPEKRPLAGTLDYYGKIEKIGFTKTGKIDWEGMIITAVKELLRGETSCSGEDGYKSIEALIAAHISHEKGHIPIFLPLDNPMDIQRRLKIA